MFRPGTWDRRGSLSRSEGRTKSLRIYRDLIRRFISSRATVPPSEDMRTDFGKVVNCRAFATVVGELVEWIVLDLRKAIQNGLVTSRVIGTEPGLVSGRTSRDTLKVSGGRSGIFLGLLIRSMNLDLLFDRTPSVGSPLLVDMPEGGNITRKLGLGNSLNRGVYVLRGAIGVDVSEEVRWFDGVVSDTGSNEVVRDRA